MNTKHQPDFTANLSPKELKSTYPNLIDDQADVLYKAYMYGYCDAKNFCLDSCAILLHIYFKYNDKYNELFPKCNGNLVNIFSLYTHATILETIEKYKQEMSNHTKKEKSIYSVGDIVEDIVSGDISVVMYSTNYYMNLISMDGKTIHRDEGYNLYKKVGHTTVEQLKELKDYYNGAL